MLELERARAEAEQAAQVAIIQAEQDRIARETYKRRGRETVPFLHFRGCRDPFYVPAW